MSFLDVLDSIGTRERTNSSLGQQSSTAILEQPQPLPIPLKAKPEPTSHSPLPSGSSDVPSGTNKSIHNPSRSAPHQPQQVLPKQKHSSGLQQRTASIKVMSQTSPQTLPARVAKSASLVTSAKKPPSGSFAALMAEAKVAQQQRAKSEVGQIKHQATVKERLSKTERKRREDEEKGLRLKLGKRPQHNSKVEKRVQPGAKARSESSYKGTAKPMPPVSSYKGTAGRPSQHRSSPSGPRQQKGKKSTRYDEYLGTDEEDEIIGSDVDELDDKSKSDVSSDMEAGALDVEEEESKALREARADDAKELALENKMRREKEERRRRLQALANKRR